jgi:molybdate transport system ATP-binding protein
MLTATLETHLANFHLKVDLTAELGKTTVLLGENGSGKSTILRLLAGLLVPEQGRVVMDEVTYVDTQKRLVVPPQERPFGYVFQDYMLFPHLSVFENIAFGLRAQRMPRRHILGRVEHAVAQMQLSGMESRMPSQLSGGQQQRVALARALVLQPKLLLLDEPLSALDIQTRREIRRELRHLLSEEGITTILVTHDYLEALIFGYQIVVLNQGKVLQQGSQRDLIERPRSSYIAELVGINWFRGRIRHSNTNAHCLIALTNGDAGQVLELEALLADLEEGTEPPPLGEEVSVVVDPRSITLHLSRPEGSARNLFYGKIVHIVPVGSRDRGSVRVTIMVDVLPLPLTAEVTTSSAVQMALSEGLSVYATFKVLEARAYRG